MSKRLLVVTGKGGVGKTSVAAALGLLASSRGLRTVVAEVSARNDVAALLNAPAGDRPLSEVELAPGLHHVSVAPHAALDMYLRDEVPGRLAREILARSRVFEAFAMATPGLRELLTVGTVWELSQRPRRTAGALPYDLVILDAPASGHVAGLLASPGTFSSIAGVGPIARQGATIDRALRDPRHTGVIAVATPEQMAVSELLELRTSLAERLGVALDGVVVNGLFPARFSAPDVRVLARAGNDPAVRSARWFAGHSRAQRAQLQRLRRGLAAVPSVTLPFLFAADFGRGELERLAEKLGRWLA